MGFPKFKSKDKATPRFAYTTGGFGLIDGDPKALRLPKIGRIHCMENVAKRVGDARVLRMTISRRAGRWYASLTVERDDKPVKRKPKGGAVGVDLGVKTLAALSDGTVVDNQRHLAASERKLKRAQQALSRKPKARTAAPRLVRRLHVSMRGLLISGLTGYTSSPRGWSKRTRTSVSRTYTWPGW